MLRFLISLYKEFIYGGHLQSLGAAGLIFIAAKVFQGTVQFNLPVLVYLIFYLLYVYNRYKEIEIDAKTNPERTQHFRKYLPSIPYIMAATVCLIVLWLFYFAPNTASIVFSLVLIIFGLLYTIFVKDITRIFLGFKNFYVALFFASLVYLWAIYYAYPLTWQLAVFFGIIYLKAFCMQIILDIKDIESDKEEKLKTYAILLGKQTALRLGIVSSLVISVLAFVLVLALIPNATVQGFIFLLDIPMLLWIAHLITADKKAGYIIISSQFFYLSVFSTMLYLFT